MKMLVLESPSRGQWACSLALAFAFLLTAHADQIIYDDALEDGWQDWGWAILDYTNTSPVHSGSDSIGAVTFCKHLAGNSVIPHRPGFHAFHQPQLLVGRGYQRRTNITRLWIALIRTAVLPMTRTKGQYYDLPPLPTNSWEHFSVPLSSLGVVSTQFHRLRYSRCGRRHPADLLCG